MQSTMKLLVGLAAASLCLSPAVLSAAESEGFFPPEVKRVVFLGDSITYSGQYVDTVVAWHRARYPARQIDFINLGLPSETVSGLSEPEHLTRHKFARPDLHERLDRVLKLARPDLVFACYGMNDGIYLPLNEERFAAFRKGIEGLRRAVLQAGAQIIHLTPPVYDEARGGQAGYARVLDTYAAWLLDQRTNGWTVIDVHTPMKRFLEIRRNTDPQYTFARDGVHPDDTGHWLMAQAVLVNLGASEVASEPSAQVLLSNLPKGLEVLRREKAELTLWKDAWLTAIGHQRPGMKKGLPITIDPATGTANLKTNSETGDLKSK